MGKCRMIDDRRIARKSDKPEMEKSRNLGWPFVIK
jgi:hypothetical protein